MIIFDLGAKSTPVRLFVCLVGSSFFFTFAPRIENTFNSQLSELNAMEWLRADGRKQNSARSRRSALTLIGARDGKMAAREPEAAFNGHSLRLTVMIPGSFPE